MAVVLSKIFEDAHLSGELRLSGRKLKDFPKITGKYDLSDTVIADLSRNRFCEMPEDVTAFPFLETLVMYHNTLRSIPETVRGLHSLTFLDLRSNLLSVLPRELCFLPIQILLVSNNRLVSLPEELGRMEHLTELDAACNQITHLPARMNDLKNLKSLSLRSNHLVYLPRDVTCLSLVSLDLSGNRIASLPVELRFMTNLVHLELENNPLTSPPASLCMRGIVHVFKYLDTMAFKEERTRAGGTFDGYTTLRRTNSTPKQNTLESQKPPQRPNTEPDCAVIDEIPKYSPTHQIRSLSSDSSPTSNGTPPFSPSHAPATPAHNGSTTSANGDNDILEELKRPQPPQESPTPKRSLNGNNNNSMEMLDGDLSPDNPKSEEKMKAMTNVQTYKEYKEALRQQRNQDSTPIYRSRDHQSTPTQTPSPTFCNSNLGSPISPVHSLLSQKSSTPVHQNGSPIHQMHHIYMNSSDALGMGNDKPMHKVSPSQNGTPTKYPLNTSNGNSQTVEIKTKDCYGIYIKPNSPAKNTGSLGYNSMPAAVTANNNKNGAVKSNRTASWKRDVPAEKLSFTMRREFDRQKEETELISQLRSIIETRLKMSLPKDDIASALIDGVVLCHLANHVRPRSVASIHVPSPAVVSIVLLSSI